MSNADETIKQAVKESLDLLTEQAKRGKQGGQATVDKVTERLDTPKIRQAIAESDSARDDARRSALSQKENPDDYPEVKPDTGD